MLAINISTIRNIFKNKGKITQKYTGQDFFPIFSCSPFICKYVKNIIDYSICFVFCLFSLNFVSVLFYKLALKSLFAV